MEFQGVKRTNISCLSRLPVSEHVPTPAEVEQLPEMPGQLFDVLGSSRVAEGRLAPTKAAAWCATSPSMRFFWLPLCRVEANSPD